MVLSIDIGTTSVKAGIVDENGRLVSFRRIGFPGKNASAAGNANPRNWISCLNHAVARLDGKSLKRIRAVVVCGNGPSLVATDANGDPLGTPVLWTNVSGRDEAKRLREISGGKIDPSFFLMKALAFKTSAPELYDRTAYFLPCPEYAGFVLTGNPHAILPTPDYERFYWDANAISRLGMDPAKFPGFVGTGSVIGKVAKRAERILGVRQGVPVIAGGPDFVMSLLGTGSVRRSDTCDRAGSSEGINFCSAEAPNDTRLFAVPHIVPGLVNVSAILSASGTSLDWMLRVLGRDGHGYESVYETADPVPPGSNGLSFFPHLIRERNAIWGERRAGAFTGLTTEHGKAEMIRAVMESSGFAVRKILDVFGENNLQVDSIRVSGGSATSRSWCRMRADMTGRRILVPEIVHSEITGCACVAYEALGEFPSFYDAASSLVRIRETIDPGKEASAAYDEAYARYSAIDEVLASGDV